MRNCGGCGDIWRIQLPRISDPWPSGKTALASYPGRPAHRRDSPLPRVLARPTGGLKIGAPCWPLLPGMVMLVGMLHSSSRRGVQHLQSELQIGRHSCFLSAPTSVTYIATKYTHQKQTPVACSHKLQIHANLQNKTSLHPLRMPSHSTIHKIPLPVLADVIVTENS